MVFLQSIVRFCLAFSGARLVAAAPQIHARQEYSFANVSLVSYHLTSTAGFSTMSLESFQVTATNVPSRFT